MGQVPLTSAFAVRFFFKKRKGQVIAYLFKSEDFPKEIYCLT